MYVISKPTHRQLSNTHSLPSVHFLGAFCFWWIPLVNDYLVLLWMMTLVGILILKMLSTMFSWSW